MVDAKNDYTKDAIADEPPTMLHDMASIYLAASTPKYLYRRFREIGFTSSYADAFTAWELVNQIIEVDESDPEDLIVDAVVMAYTCAVGLTFKEWDEVEGALKGVKIKKLRWIGHMIDFGFPGKLEK